MYPEHNFGAIFFLTSFLNLSSTIDVPIAVGHTLPPRSFSLRLLPRLRSILHKFCRLLPRVLLEQREYGRDVQCQELAWGESGVNAL